MPNTYTIPTMTESVSILHHIIHTTDELENTIYTYLQLPGWRGDMLWLPVE